MDDLRALVLVGMMGSGKSTVGKRLADSLGREHRDTDDLVRGRLCRSIEEIFARYGEPTFRQHETSILKGLEPGPYVLSTGGGIVLGEENWTEMRRLGTTLYLRVGLETLVARLTASKRKRPLLQTERWPERLASILEARRPLYEQADLVVDVDVEPIEVAIGRIREALGVGD